MMARASLDDLAAFAVVARHRGFTQAAAKLGISTSNLSHTIRRLEERLGYQVIQRSSRSVAASEAGERLLQILSPALASIEEALEAINEDRSKIKGTLRLTVTRQAYDAI